MLHRLCTLLLTLCALSLTAAAQPADTVPADTARYAPLLRRLIVAGLETDSAFALLRELVDAAPHRLSGSDGARVAVGLTTDMMRRLGFQEVHQESVMVPHWVRGREEGWVAGRKPYRLGICALGGSVATPKQGITAGLVEVHSFEELRGLGPAARGKIIFFNRPMDPTKIKTFEAYGGAVDQRGRGAVEAARAGGVAALVRSMSLRRDRVPHTGAMGYTEGVPEVPGAAVSTVDADSLSAMLRRNPGLRVHLRLDCRTLPDAPSANVVGEIRGSARPEEVVLVSGHLDCWDKGQGAHDDGSGCMQAIEALRLLRAAGVRPARTIRAVMFMNEENGARGGKGYVTALRRAHERHIAALESDAGGFAPLGFRVQADSIVLRKVARWSPLFALLGAGAFSPGGGGTDIGPLAKTGVPGFGLDVENQRYFDCHHSDNDRLDAVNPRELELGAIAEALLCYILSEEGL
ncbi:MAG TPA: M20/M25/M40 family metallo-hydrolase [Bacteroidota bacterium]